MHTNDLNEIILLKWYYYYNHVIFSSSDAHVCYGNRLDVVNYRDNVNKCFLFFAKTNVNISLKKKFKKKQGSHR